MDEERLLRGVIKSTRPSIEGASIPFFPTYKKDHGLIPQKTIRFPAEPTKRLIDATLSKHLTKVKYDFETIPELTKTIANDLLAQVKRKLNNSQRLYLRFFFLERILEKKINGVMWRWIEMEYERYKFVVHVEIGEFKGQGVKVGSRALWDVSTDTFASGSFRNVCGLLGS
jgi:hypothetical protein